MLALLHKTFSFATADTKNEWSVRQNPATGIPRFHEEKRERWLSEDELQRLAVALQEYPDRCAAEADVSEKQRKFLRTEAQRAMNAMRLSMVTGCRSLPIVGKLLGHTQPQTTARYAHLADNPLREAANRFPAVL